MKQQCDWIIATALPEEYQAAVSLLVDPQSIPSWNFPAEQGMVGTSRVICILSGKGGPETAAALQFAIHHCTAEKIALIGIAGGFPDKKIHRGDVIVAKTVLSSEFGKLVDGQFLRRPEYDMQCDVSLVRHAELVGLDQARPWFDDIKSARPDQKPNSASSLHTGYVVSGEKVVDDADHAYFQEVRGAVHEIHAVEMEGVGAGASIRLTQVNRLARFILIKGISDEVQVDASLPPSAVAGTGQRKEWKKYAAEAAAVLTRRLIEAVSGRKRGAAPAAGNPPRTMARGGLPAFLATLQDARALWSLVDGVITAGLPHAASTPIESSRFVHPEEVGDKAERSIVHGLVVLAAHCGALGGSMDEVLRKSISWVLEDRNSWNVGIRSLILAAFIASLRGQEYQWHEDNNISAYLTGRVEPAGRADRVAVLVMLYAHDDASARMAGIVATARGKLGPEDLGHPVLITCETLRACLVATAEVDPAALTRMVSRIRLILDLVDLSFYDKLKRNAGDNKVRLLIIYCHVVQCRKIILALAHDERCIEKLESLESHVLGRIKTCEPIIKAAGMNARAARDCKGFWQIEAACLHVNSDWKHGKIRGSLRDALIQYYDVVVNERSSHSGPGWNSWAQIMRVFGRNCEDEEVRRIAADAARKRETFGGNP